MKFSTEYCVNFVSPKKCGCASPPTFFSGYKFVYNISQGRMEDITGPVSSGKGSGRIVEIISKRIGQVKGSFRD